MATAPSRSGLATAPSLEASQRFLLRHQQADGSWADWALPPGPSDCWTTAYVGRQLAAANEPLRAASARPREAAAGWLAAREFSEGGWGYNDRVGADGDSTAHALLFLAAERLPIPTSAYERLLALQLGDGGFATYPPDGGLGSWGASHPDVSAVAAQAMLCVSRGADGAAPTCARAREATRAVERALGYITRQRKADGTWDSFWWCSPLYATAAALSLVRSAGRVLNVAPTRTALAQIDAGNAFERALLLDCHLQIGVDPDERRVWELVEALVSEQLPDGSWRSAPILRLTDRNCLEAATRELSGPLFADPGRQFTSATVFGALSRLERAPGAASGR
jgi:squalene cyclase